MNIIIVKPWRKIVFNKQVENVERLRRIICNQRVRTKAFVHIIIIIAIIIIFPVAKASVIRRIIFFVSVVREEQAGFAVEKNISTIFAVKMIIALVPVSPPESR